MRSLAVKFGKDGQGPALGLRVGRVLCLLLLLGVIGSAAKAQTPAGTLISAFATVTYEAPNGAVFTAQSGVAVMTVAQVAGVDVEPPRSSIGDPGTTVVFNHTLANVGNGTDDISVTATSRVGWPVRVHLDANGNSALDAGDPQVGGPITLAMGDTAYLLVAVDVPASAIVRGTTDTVDVAATSGFDPAESDALLDELFIQDVGVLVSLSKVVDVLTATTGDVLTYTITYTATGINTAGNVELEDVIPLGTTYIPGTLLWNGSAQTDAADGDAGWFDGGGNRVVFRVGDLNGGDSGTVSFQVRVG
jgi:uncharacterized repeat protein (TIGR01451 family)